jgi:methanogenic corrinoid protein MtbC1
MDYLGKVSDVSDCFERERNGNGNRHFSNAFNGMRKRPRGELDFDNVVSLAKTIESELIPRLLLQHRSDANKLKMPSEATDVVGSADIERFARLVMEHDVEVATAQVAAIFASGVSLETIFLDLLTPTARLLGKMWEDDDCNFMETTIGLFRLNQLLREISRTFEIKPDYVDEAPSILLAASPGEQHTFGILMVEEFFRRAGWDVVTRSEASVSELTSLVETTRFDAVGFSLSCDMYEPELIKVIQTIRRTSSNPNLLVLVGGRWFVEHPERVSLVGADASAVDARQAIVQTRTMLRVGHERV